MTEPVPVPVPVTQPLVSVVVPAYNAARFLPDALRSALSQEHVRVECVVVDDGSTDDTPAVMAQFPAVRYHRQPNAGVSAARNQGVALSSGSFVAFLDADDAWLPGKLAAQLALFSQDPGLGLAYCGMHLCDEQLRPISRMPVPPPGAALRNTLLLEPPVVSMAQTGLMPREVFDRSGGFDERLSTSADADLVCRVALAHRVAGVDLPLVLYRQHAAQMHHDASAMLHDMTLVHEKVFGARDAPASLRRLRSRATANLHLTAALASRHTPPRTGALRHLRVALRADPARTVGQLSRLAVTRLRQARLASGAQG